MANNRDNNISVNTQTLRDAQIFIADKNQRLTDTLDSIHNKIDLLVGGTWDSDAGRAIEQKIKTFKANHFQQYKEAIDRFQRALLALAEKYEQTESAIESNANAFQS